MQGNGSFVPSWKRCTPFYIFKCLMVCLTRLIGKHDLNPFTCTGEQLGLQRMKTAGMRNMQTLHGVASMRPCFSACCQRHVFMPLSPLVTLASV